MGAGAKRSVIRLVELSMVFSFADYGRYSKFVRGLRGAVFGSRAPWVEEHLIRGHGAEHVTTVEYGILNSSIPEVSSCCFAILNAIRDNSHLKRSLFFVRIFLPASIWFQTVCGWKAKKQRTVGMRDSGTSKGRGAHRIKKYFNSSELGALSTTANSNLGSVDTAAVGAVREEQKHDFDQNQIRGLDT